MSQMFLYLGHYYCAKILSTVAYSGQIKGFIDSIV